MEKKNKKRMSDLAFETRVKVCEFIAANKESTTLINDLYLKYGLTYSEKSLVYIKRMASYPTELQKLAQDEAIMDKWRKELETHEETNYAELLDDLAKGNLDKDMFRTIVDIEHFC
jgi:hypothetical protein